MAHVHYIVRREFCVTGFNHYFENAAHVKEVPTTSFLWLIGVNNIFGTNDVICRLL